MTTATRLMELGELKGFEQGIEQGEISEKQNILIRLVSKKIGLSKDEEKFIKSINNNEKLDKAIDEIVVSDSKDEILGLLK